MQILIFCAAVLASVVHGGIPNNWPKCHNGDDACLTQAYQFVLKNFYSGVPELNLVPIDPMRIKTIVLDRSPTSSVSIETKLDNVEVTGLKDFKISSVSGFKADLSGRTTVVGVVPLIVLKGHYVIDGHVLILPIVGDGTIEIKLKNEHIKYTFDLKGTENNGQTYASIEHIKLEMEPEHVHMTLDNLFNGNKALTDSTNAFINENWKSIHEEIKENVAKGIGRLMKAAINKFFEKRPYAEHFL